MEQIFLGNAQTAKYLNIIESILRMYKVKRKLINSRYLLKNA